MTPKPLEKDYCCHQLPLQTQHQALSDLHNKKQLHFEALAQEQAEDRLLQSTSSPVLHLIFHHTAFDTHQDGIQCLSGGLCWAFLTVLQQCGHGQRMTGLWNASSCCQGKSSLPSTSCLHGSSWSIKREVLQWVLQTPPPTPCNQKLAPWTWFFI